MQTFHSCWIFLFCLTLLSSCSTTLKRGGGINFKSEEFRNLSEPERLVYVQESVLLEQRPQTFPSLHEMKTLGFVIWETQTQQTFGGLAKEKNVFFSPKAKQAFAEWTYEVLLTSFKNYASQFKWVGIKDLENNPVFRSAGSRVNDEILDRPFQWTTHDVFIKNRGEKTDGQSVYAPFGAQDLSLLLVPATQMMITTKPVQHQKHWLNDLHKSNSIDAFILGWLQIDWAPERIDQQKKTKTPARLTLVLNTAILFPFALQEKWFNGGQPLALMDKKSLSWGTYELKTEVNLTDFYAQMPSEFPDIEKRFLTLLKRETQTALESMALRLSSDLFQWQNPTPSLNLEKKN